MNSKTVLVWVTNPEACTRIVNAGRKLADELDCSLFIVSIQNNLQDNSDKRAMDLEILHTAARTVGAELNVVFSENAFKAANDVITKVRPTAMITGLPGNEGKSAFLEHIISVDDTIQTYVIDANGNVVRFDILDNI